jgi:hypothetical protein
MSFGVEAFCQGYSPDLDFGKNVMDGLSITIFIPQRAATGLVDLAV